MLYRYTTDTMWFCLSFLRLRAEGMGFEPTSRSPGNRFSKPAGQPYPATFRFKSSLRFQISNFRLFQTLNLNEWTAGELNPNFLVASQEQYIAGPGIEPGVPAL
jgi:hypothetical protein